MGLRWFGLTASPRYVGRSSGSFVIVATDEEIKSALAGDTGRAVSVGLVLAVKSLTDWPVDAIAVDLDHEARRQTVVWLQGDSVGVVVADGGLEEPEIAGVVRPLHAIEAIEFCAKVVDRSGVRPTIDRAIRVSFSSGDVINVDVGKYVATHFRARADEFITGLLQAVAGRSSTP